jgi:hypothetical protein
VNAGRSRWLGAAACWAAAVVLAAVAGRSPAAESAAGLAVSTTGTLPGPVAHSVDLQENGALVRANGPDPFVVLAPPPSPVRSLRLELIPTGSVRHDFYLYYVPAAAPATAGFSEQYVQRGRVIVTPAGWRVEWELPEAARLYRLDVPDDAVFRVTTWQASRTAGALSTHVGSARDSAWTVLLAVLLVAGGIAVVQPAAITSLDLARTGIAVLAVPAAALLLLVPPFQGPDESAHWMLALSYSRPAITAEPAAYRLPAIFGTDAMRFNTEVKFDPARFRTELAAAPLTRTEYDAQQKYLFDIYPYARPYLYPLVTAVCAVYPHVDSVAQAVLLFYICRIVAAAALFLCLLYASRRYEVPLSVLAFFSLPLVLQQHTTVTSDVLLNLGAAGAALFFLHHRRHRGRVSAICVWLLTAAVVSVKFIYAPLFVLPVLTIPRGRMRTLVLGGMVVAAVLAAYPFALLVLREVRALGAALGRGPATELQIASLATSAGWSALLSHYVRYATALVDPAAWSGPLGWLDTPLAPSHVALIRTTIAGTLLVDAVILVAARGERLRRAAAGLAFGVAAIAVTLFIDVVLFYLLTTNPGAADVAGVQVRHLFPIAHAAAMLSLAPRDGTPPMLPIVRGLAAIGFAALVLMRTALLAQDLLVRFW